MSHAHVHPCPKCFRDERCTDDCTREPPYYSRGVHLVCSECAGEIEHVDTDVMRSVIAELERWERSPSLACQTVAASMRPRIHRRGAGRDCDRHRSGTEGGAMSEADMLTAAGWKLARNAEPAIRRHWTKDGVDWYTEAEALHEVLATQLEQMRRDLADLRARGVVPDADCTCGSGGHPRPCNRHPHRMEMHAREIDAENALEQMRRERDEWKRVYNEACDMLDRAYADNLAVTRERDEARATNARLHRRAQGVDARKPDDEETIRRLRAEVRATAKHAGHVIGYVFRLRCALSDSQHATSMAVRERDEARAHAEERTAKVRDLARCAAASEARARAYAAKLERVREVVLWRYDSMTTACEALADVLRIIDEKEGGQ